MKEWRQYLEESEQENQIVIDHKNLIYFQDTRIINRRQVWWILKVQDIPFKLEFQPEKKNIMIDMITRKENTTELIESRSIFLQNISLNKAKKEEYYSLIKISELEKDSDEIWWYREKQIIENPEK